MLRVGIYGGAFAPIHNGHVAAAKEFMKAMWLDVLFVIPTGTSPHKQMDRGATDVDRLEMCRLAFEGVEGVIVSDMEIRRQGKSYTVDTLRELTAEDRRLFLLCGTDMILTLDTWKDPDEIFKLCYPTYIRREEDETLDARLIEKVTAYRNKYGKNVVRINAPAIVVSSSEVRRRISTGEDVSALIPPAVEAYIREKGLYRNGD
ncbi:MAG: nicotinate-nucleotide adenylyltransferase [Clostridia bacterium]|nr:nicotinate-nucleotide adenylyltransferase [Clostridia bacterium]